MQTVKTSIRDGDDNVVGILGVFWDITERKRAEEQREKALHDTRERMKELACIYQVTDLSQAAGTVEELFHDVVTVIPPGWQYPEITRAKLSFDGREYVSQPFEETPWRLSSDIVIRGEKRGTVEVYYLEERPELDEGPFAQEERNLLDGLARVLSEAAERKRAEDERDRLHAELQVRAITDGLTGLYNHAHFFERLAEEIDRSNRYGRGFAVLMMDVDKFKQLNDTRGHQAGDDALCLIANCIRTGVRRSDIAFRYGGDEFAAILLHADSSRAQAIAKRVKRCLARRLEEANDPAATWLRLSTGIACFPDDATTADDLVKVADTALYDAKRVALPCSAEEQEQAAEPLAAAGAAARRKR